MSLEELCRVVTVDLPQDRIGEAEAVYLAELVDSMPPDQRAALRARFDAAMDKLDRAGLLKDVRGLRELDDARPRHRLGMAYFQQAIPCPFLENEACSIHPHRPLSCREYLVTSPASHCADPGPGRIHQVPVPRKLSTVLYRFGDGAGRDRTRWLPLVLALEWVAQNPEIAERRFPGPTLFENFLSKLSGSMPPAGSPDSEA